MKDSPLAIFNWKDCLNYFGGEEASAKTSLATFKKELINLHQQLTVLPHQQFDQGLVFLKDDWISMAAYCGMPRLQAILCNVLCWVNSKELAINSMIRKLLLQEIEACLSALDEFLSHHAETV